MVAFLQDTRCSLRYLARHPGFSVVAIVVLSLGVCATASVFHLGHGLLLAPPPHVQEPGELVRICPYDANRNASYWTYPDYAFFRENLQASISLAASSIGETLMSVSRGETALSANVAYVSGNYFAALKVTPTVGRTFSPHENDRLGEPPVALASLSFSRRLFGDLADAIDVEIEVNGVPVTIVGVIPSDFHGVSPLEGPKDLWLPLGLNPVLNPANENPLERGDATITWLEVVGRLEPDLSLAAAQARVDAVTAALGHQEPTWSASGVEVLSDYRYMPGDATDLTRRLAFFAAAVVAVLIVACANMALLLLARVLARRRDVGIRLALGAPRWRVTTWVLTESSLLAVAGGAGGLLLSFWGTGLAAAALPRPFPLDFTPSLLAAIWTTGLTFGLTLLLCSIPALRASRTSLAEIVHGSHSAGGGGRIRDGLIVVQTWLAVLLVTGAAVFVRSYLAATAVDLGFEAEDRLVLPVDLGSQGYDGQAALSFLERALAEVGAVAGVHRVSATAMPPFTGLMTTSIGPEGSPSDELLRTGYNAGGPGYFATMGIELISGRDFTLGDRAGAPPVVAVNETAAQRLWPGADPLNRSLTVMGSSATVVAVVGDTRFRRIGKEPPPYAYRPLLQTSAGHFTLIVETTGPAETLARVVEETVRSLDRRLPLPAATPMTDLVDRVIRPYRVGAELVSLFGALTLALAMVGLYGSLLHGVLRNRPVIGLQMALGASPGRIVVSVLRRATLLGGTGFLLGLGTYWFLARFVESFLFQVEALDWTSLGAVAFGLWAVVVLASSHPAWQAARVDPTSILREE